MARILRTSEEYGEIEWLARVEGLCPQYLLRRRFLDDDRQDRKPWREIGWTLPPGLYHCQGAVGRFSLQVLPDGTVAKLSLIELCQAAYWREQGLSEVADVEAELIRQVCDGIVDGGTVLRMGGVAAKLPGAEIRHVVAILRERRPVGFETCEAFLAVVPRPIRGSHAILRPTLQTARNAAKKVLRKVAESQRAQEAGDVQGGQEEISQADLDALSGL